MTITTTPRLWARPLQFIVETTEGTTPTTGTTTVCPPVKSFSIKVDGNYVDVAQIGPEDLLKLTRGQLSYESSVTFYITSAADETYLIRALNAANFATPSGTISETTSMIYAFYFNGTTINYVTLRGSRPKSAAIKVSIGNPHEITVDFVHTNIVTPTSTAPTGLTLSSTFPSGTVADWLSGGVAPVSVIGVTADIVEFNCTINRNTTPDYVLGSASPHSSQPHGRRISGDIKILHTATTTESNFSTPTAGTISCVLITGTSTFTVSNANLTTYGRDQGADDTEATMEAVGFKGLSCTIA